MDQALDLALAELAADADDGNRARGLDDLWMTPVKAPVLRVA